MEVLELNLDPEGVPDWDVWCGVREFIQNWSDNPNESFWDYSDGDLTLGNADTKVERSIFLSGYSGKRGDDSTVGKFGDGVGSAITCLLREGKSIFIDNDDILWKPVVSMSDTYKRDLICIEELVAETYTGTFVVTICGIKEQEFATIKQNYLGFKDDVNILYKAKQGDILGDESEKGRIYVNGLFVDSVSGLSYGYNFKPEYLSLDRDRMTVRDFDVMWNTKEMVNQMMNNNKDNDNLDAVIAGMITNNAKDVTYMHHSSGSVSCGVEEKVMDVYEEKYSGKILASSSEEFDKLKASGYHNVAFTDNEIFAKVVKSNAKYQSMTENVKVKSPEEILDDYKDKWYDQFSTESLDDYNDMSESISKLF